MPLGSLRLWNLAQSLFNRPHQAFRHQQRNIALERFIHRSHLHIREQRLEALERAAIFHGQRIQKIMQIRMPNLLHLDRRARGRRNHDVVIRSVIACVGLAGRAHRIQIDGELPSQVARRWQLQIDLGVERHLRQRIVIDLGQFRVARAVSLPDRVQTDFLRRRPASAARCPPTLRRRAASPSASPSA